MNPSIRKYLLINLLLGTTVIILLTAIGNYYLSQRDIERHFDVILSQSAYIIDALVTDTVNKNSSPQELHRLQQLINAIPYHMEEALKNEYDTPKYIFHGNLEFQIWNKAGRLILSSKDSPVVPFSHLKAGYTTRKLDHEPWRIFSSINPKMGTRIIVAERYNSRTALGHRITNDFLFIMLLAYPLVGLLIWGIVGRGLASIQRVANEVSHRAPDFLDPVEVKSVPIEIKPVVDELNNLFLRLNSAIEREKRFAGDAAHELRTPLAALQTQAQVAIKAMRGENIHPALLNVLAGVERCTHVVEQLLTLSRMVPESTTMKNLAEIELPYIVAQVIADIAPYAVEKKIDIELKTPAEHNTIVCNATTISILTRNLVDNAIRYTPDGGQIKVSIINDEDKHVILKVQDSGPGIPPELRARVFERFFRVLGNQAPGSGLGLAIVHQIASLHHAAVKLSAPEEGHGLVIEVIFPPFNQ